MDKKEELLSELVKRLQEAYGGDLRSVILYGSGAMSDHQTKYSNLNVLCVLTRLGLEDLRKGQRAVEWWTKQKQPAPLLVTQEEVACRGDVYPIEFLDIRQSHRLLHGEDPFASINVDRTNHRRQVEHELASGLLRLRQRYLVLHPNNKDVLRLMLDSISSFATLARHALMLAQTGTDAAAPAKKREIFAAAAAKFALDAAPFETVLQLREESVKLDGNQVHALFASYLDQITKLEEAVDKL